MFFYDESPFSVNGGHNIMWGYKRQKIIKPKSRGAGMTVSDFNDEHQRFLAVNK